MSKANRGAARSGRGTRRQFPAPWGLEACLEAAASSEAQLPTTSSVLVPTRFLRPTRGLGQASPTSFMTYKKEKDAIIVYQKENSKKGPQIIFLANWWNKEALGRKNWWRSVSACKSSFLTLHSREEALMHEAASSFPRTAPYRGSKMRNAHLYGTQQAPVPFLEIPPYSGSAVLSLAHRPVGNRTGRLSTPRVRSHQLNHEGAKRRYFILAFLKTKAITCSKSELMKKSLCMHCKVVLAQLVSAALLCRWQTAGGGSIPAGPRVRIKTVDPPKGNGLGKKKSLLAL